MEERTTAAQIQKRLPQTRAKVLNRLIAHTPETEIASELEISEATLRKHVSLLYGDFRQVLPSKKSGQRNSMRELLSLFSEESSPPSIQDSSSSEIYIPFPEIEKLCFQEIEKNRGLLRIQAPRQMGKTSLLNQCLNHYSNNEEYITINVGFLQLYQQKELREFNNLERLLRWFCISVDDSLRQELTSEKYQYKYLADEKNWQNLSAGNDKMKCTAFFENILDEIGDDKKLIIGLDNLGILWEDKNTDEEKEIADEFLSMLRFWHDEAGSNRVLARLRLILTYRKPHKMRVDISPFNVGRCIFIPKLNHHQIEEIIERYNLKIHENRINQLIELIETEINGHPYLLKKCIEQVQLLLSADLSIDDFLVKIRKIDKKDESWIVNTEILIENYFENSIINPKEVAKNT